MKNQVNKMVKMAMLSALSIVLMLIIRFPIIPSAPFLIYEPADVPMLIGSFIYGPIAGIIITVVTALIQALTVSAADGWVGFVMHVIATGTLVTVAGVIYKRFHTRTGAAIALISGAIAMTLVMVPANLFITAKFYGIPYDTVKTMLLTAIVPFNLIKSGINSVVVFIVYKYAGKILRGSETMRNPVLDKN